MLENIREPQYCLCNNFEIISDKFPHARIKLFQTDVEEIRNNFEIIIFHM